MKQKKQLLICIAIPLLVGGLSGWLTRGSMAAFASLNQPPLSPPGWVFPVVWTMLYILMGVASYLVLTSGKPGYLVNRALTLYGIQLIINFFWPILFFNLSLYLFSFFWLVLLWIFVLAVIVQFCRITQPASHLMIPYLVWLTFAGYLNFGIYLLN